MNLTPTQLATLKTASAALLALASLAAQAQSLTNAQLTTLKACINAVPAWAELPLTSASAATIAAGLNKEANPAWVVWRSDVQEIEIMSANGWDWTRVDNLSAGKARMWEWMFKFGFANFGQSNIRAGVDAVWVGTAADLAVRAAVYTVAKRNATVGEKCLSTGTGTTVAPAVTGYEGAISTDAVQQARELQ